MVSMKELRKGKKYTYPARTNSERIRILKKKRQSK
jgi:hypothetical protein